MAGSSIVLIASSDSAAYRIFTTDHALDQLAGGLSSHAVIDLPPGQDDVRVVSERFGLVGEVVAIDYDAVPADQAGCEFSNFREAVMANPSA